MCPPSSRSIINSGQGVVTKRQYSVYFVSLVAILSYLRLKSIWQSIRSFVKHQAECRQGNSWSLGLPIASPRVVQSPTVELEGISQMSQTEPNSFTCPSCEKDMNLTVANAVFYLFVYQPWVSYWHLICPNCDQKMRCFVRDNLQWEHEWAEKNYIGMITQFFPDADELAGYEETYDVHPISAHDLSDYEEKEVAFFRYLLDKYSPYEELG